MQRKILIGLTICLLFLSVNSINLKALAAETEVTSVTYTGNINDMTNHIYNLKIITGGTIAIKNNASTKFLGFLINSNGDPFEDGDNLSSGNYYFVVTNEANDSSTYSFTVSGVELIKQSGNLPTLSLTNPTSKLTRLTKGATSIGLSGSATGYSSLGYTVNNTKFNLTNPFNISAWLSFGANSLNVNAQNNVGSTQVPLEVVSPGMKRIAGPTAFDDSVAASKEISNLGLGSKTIVIVNSTSYSDGIVASSLAFKEGAPILLTEEDTIPTVVQNEIKRLKPTKAILIGGTNKVSTSVESQLKALNITTIKRYSGSTRYATATAVANEILPPKTASGEGISSDATNKNINVTAVVVNGFSETYMMDIASLAVPNGLPILLTNGETLTSSVKDYIKSNPQINSFILIGNESNLSSSVANELSSLGSVSRIENTNRFDLGPNVSKYFYMKPKSFIVANDLGSGVIASTLGALKGYQVLVTDPDKLHSSVSAHIQDSSPDNIYTIGKSVSTNISNTLNGFIK